MSSSTNNNDDIQQQINKVNDMLHEKYKKLLEQEKAFEKDKAQFEESRQVVASFKDPVKLNVGGTIFMTSKATLMKEQSMFQAMFSGRHTLEVHD